MLTIVLVIKLHTIKDKHCRIIFLSFCVHTVELVGFFRTAYGRVVDHEQRQALTWYDLTVLSLAMHHPPVLLRCILLSLSCFCSPFLFSAVRWKVFTNSSPPLQLRGVHQTRWQPSPAQRRGSFCGFNSIQHVVGPSAPHPHPSWQSHLS